MKTKTLLLGLTVSLLFSTITLAPVFEYRGVGLGRLGNVEAEIQYAASHGMNYVDFSADLGMEWDEITNDHETWCALAGSLGMESYIWTSQIYKPPAQYVDGAGMLLFDEPGLWDWLYNLYATTVSNKVPSATGIVLYLTESDFQIHRGPHDPYKAKGKVISTLSPEARMAKVINTVRDALASRGKKLIVRDFFRTPYESELFVKAMDSVPTDVIVYSKHVANDFRLCHATNPNLGVFTNRDQIMEIEPSWSGGANYYQSQYQLARDLGVEGTCPRIRWGETPHPIFRDFNNETYYELVHDPDLNLDTLYISYFTDVFGTQEAATVAMPHIKKLFTMRYNCAYPLDEFMDWGGKPGSSVPKCTTAEYNLDYQNAAEWSEDAGIQANFSAVMMGGMRSSQIVADAEAQMQWVDDQATAALADLTANQSYFLQNFSMIYSAFEEYKYMGESMRWYVHSLFPFHYYRNNADDTAARDDSYAAHADLVAYLDGTTNEHQGMGSYESDLLNNIDAVKPAYRPYGGTPIGLPGKIQAEDYAEGGQGIAYYDKTSGNSGGQYRSDDVDIYTGDGGYVVYGSSKGGEWLKFLTSSTDAYAKYNITARVQSTDGADLSLWYGETGINAISYKEEELGDFVVPAGEAYQTLTLIPRKSELTPTGVWPMGLYGGCLREVQLRIDTGKCNINWVEFAPPSEQPPSKATNPDPANEETGVSVSADLSWTAGGGADSHDVYFGTTSPGDSQGNQAETTFNPPGDMDNSTTYYWRIDEVNTYGTTTGDVWSFTTGAPAEVYVYDIDMSWYEGKTGYYVATATVWIKDTALNDIDGATVTGDWSGASSQTGVEGITDEYGKTTIESKAVKGGGTYTFTVTDVSATGYTYNPSLNVETYDSVTAP